MSQQPPEQQVTCPNCKGTNPPAALKCMWCGAELRQVAGQPTYSPPPQQVNITNISTEKPKRRILPLVVGLLVVCVVLGILSSALRPPTSVTTTNTTNQGAVPANTQAQAGTEPTATTEQEVAASELTVGSTAESAGLKITLNDVRREPRGRSAE